MADSVLLGLIVGGAIGGILLFAIIGFTCFQILKGSKRTKRDIYKKNLLAGPNISTLSQASTFKSHDRTRPYWSSSPAPDKVWGSVPNDIHSWDVSSRYSHNAMPQPLRQNIYGAPMYPYGARPWLSNSEPQALNNVPPIQKRRKERNEIFRWPRAVYQAKSMETNFPPEDVEEIVTPIEAEVIVENRRSHSYSNFMRQLSETEEEDRISIASESEAGRSSKRTSRFDETDNADVARAYREYIVPASEIPTIILTRVASQKTPSNPEGRVSARSIEGSTTGKKVTTSAFEFLDGYDDDSYNQHASRPSSTASQKDTVVAGTPGRLSTVKATITEDPEPPGVDPVYAVGNKSKT